MAHDQSNAILARWARDALREYDRVSGGGLTEEGLLPMLLASLHHLADQQRWDFARASRAADALYETEVE